MRRRLRGLLGRLAGLEAADAPAGGPDLWAAVTRPGEMTPAEREAFGWLFEDGSADPLPAEEELKAMAVAPTDTADADGGPTDDV